MPTSSSWCAGLLRAAPREPLHDLYFSGAAGRAMTLRRKMAWNLAGSGLPLLLGAVAIPYLVAQAGIEVVGILTLIWALIGYFSLFDFGLGRALTQQVASAQASGHHRQIPALVKSGLVFTLATGGVGGLVLALVAAPLGQHWLQVSAPLQSSVVVSLWVAALGIPLTTVTTGLRGVLEAHEDFRAANVLRLMLGLANFGLPVLCVMLAGPSLVWITGSLVAARVAVLGAHVWQVNRTLGVSWLAAKWRWQDARPLFSFGVWMTVSNVVGPLMVTADRFFISAALGAAMVAYYTVPADVVTRVLIIPGAVTTVLFPRLAALRLQDTGAAQALYQKSLKWIAALMVPVCLALGVGAYPGLAWWLGPEFAENSWHVVAILSVGILFNSLAFVPFAAIQAAGQASATAKIHLTELLAYVPLLWLALMFGGLGAAAAVWSLRTGVDLCALLVTARRLGFGRGMTVGVSA